MNPDLGNAIFEAGGAVLLWLNVRQLLRDKQLRGVALWPTMWFNLWGAWNLYYYHAIGQTLSWLAGFGVFAANSVWVGLALYYRFRCDTITLAHPAADVFAVGDVLSDGGRHVRVVSVRGCELRVRAVSP